MRSWRFLKDFFMCENRIYFATVHTFVPHFLTSQNEKRSKQLFPIKILSRLVGLQWVLYWHWFVMDSVEDDWHFSLDVPLATSYVTRINRIEWLDGDRVRLSYWNIEFELLDVDIIKFFILCPGICDTGRIEYNNLDRIEIVVFFIWITYPICF